MTGYLLDTNVVSELRRGTNANPNVTAWFVDHRDSEMWLSVLVLGELRRGEALIARRDPSAGQVIGAWVDSVVLDYSDRLLPVTVEIAGRWGVLSVPNPIPAVDGLLAATAIEHGLTLVTRNVADIERTGVHWHNPFEAT